jgi:hypothetical protein
LVSTQSGRRDLYDRTVISFETSHKNLCRPAPGDEFSFRVEVEQKHRSNTYIGNPPPRMTIGSEVSCKMATDNRPAGELLSGADGEALLARCERITKTGERTLLEYTFLKESSIYVLLKEAAERHTISIDTGTPSTTPGAE